MHGEYLLPIVLLVLVVAYLLLTGTKLTLRSAATGVLLLGIIVVAVVLILRTLP